MTSFSAYGISPALRQDVGHPGICVPSLGRYLEFVIYLMVKCSSLFFGLGTMSLATDNEFFLSLFKENYCGLRTFLPVFSSIWLYYTVIVLDCGSPNISGPIRSIKMYSSVLKDFKWLCKILSVVVMIKSGHRNIYNCSLIYVAVNMYFFFNFCSYLLQFFFP
jgi:hypothetical protein